MGYGSCKLPGMCAGGSGRSRISAAAVGNTAAHERPASHGLPLTGGWPRPVPDGDVLEHSVDS